MVIVSESPKECPFPRSGKNLANSFSWTFE